MKSRDSGFSRNALVDRYGIGHDHGIVAGVTAGPVARLRQACPTTTFLADPEELRIRHGRCFCRLLPALPTLRKGGRRGARAVVTLLLQAGGCRLCSGRDKADGQGRGDHEFDIAGHCRYSLCLRLACPVCRGFWAKGSKSSGLDPCGFSPYTPAVRGSDESAGPVFCGVPLFLRHVGPAESRRRQETTT